MKIISLFIATFGVLFITGCTTPLFDHSQEWYRTRAAEDRERMELAKTNMATSLRDLNEIFNAQDMGMISDEQFRWAFQRIYRETVGDHREGAGSVNSGASSSSYPSSSGFSSGTRRYFVPNYGWVEESIPRYATLPNGAQVLLPNGR